MQKVLVQLLTKAVLQYSILLLSIRKDHCIDVLKKIYECLQILFKGMRFSEPVQARCFRVAFISGDENINQMIFFISDFLFHQDFLELSEVAAHGFSEIFGKLLGKTSVV